MKRYCLALDLKDDLELIEEYKQYHREVWPEIEESYKSVRQTTGRREAA